MWFVEAVQAIELDPGDGPQALEEDPGEAYLLGVDGLDALRQDPRDTGLEAGDAHDVGCPVLEAIGILVEVGLDGRAHARAAGSGVPDLDPLPDVEPADARRAQVGTCAR